MHTEKCPICEGKGKLSYHLYRAVVCIDLNGTAYHSEPYSSDGYCKLCRPKDGGMCHGCKGRGWVEVGDEGNMAKQPTCYWVAGQCMCGIMYSPGTVCPIHGKTD